MNIDKIITLKTSQNEYYYAKFKGITSKGDVRIAYLDEDGTMDTVSVLELVTPISDLFSKKAV